jgi:hypothetical protein
LDCFGVIIYIKRGVLIMNETFEKMLAVGLSIIVVLAVLYGVGEAMVKKGAGDTNTQVNASVTKLNGTAPSTLLAP